MRTTSRQVDEHTFAEVAEMNPRRGFGARKQGSMVARPGGQGWVSGEI